MILVEYLIRPKKRHHFSVTDIRNRVCEARWNVHHLISVAGYAILLNRGPPLMERMRIRPSPSTTKNISVLVWW